MTSQTTSPLRAGEVLEIRFPTFTPRIIVHSERELTVKIVAGENEGFSDTVEYQAIAVRDGIRYELIGLLTPETHRLISNTPVHQSKVHLLTMRCGTRIFPDQFLAVGKISGFK